MKMLLAAVVAAGLSSAALAAPVTYTGPTAANIDQGSQQSFDFTVTDSGTIASLTVTIQTSRNYGDDVTFWLSHLGVTVKLYNGAGDTSGSYIDATFSDAATTIAPYNGTASGVFLPVLPLSAFNGLELAGVYSILTQDLNTPGDGTALLASSITVDTAAVPEPAMLGLFGLGALGLGLSRRRMAA